MSKNCCSLKSPEESAKELIQCAGLIAGSALLVAHNYSQGNLTAYKFFSFIFGVSIGLTGLVIKQTFEYPDCPDLNPELGGLPADPTYEY